MLSHCLLSYTEEKLGSSAQNELQELLFKAYFTDGDYPDVDLLARLAVEVGHDKEDVVQRLQSSELQEIVKREAKTNSRRTRGVPFFIFNGEPGFSGDLMHY